MDTSYKGKILVAAPDSSGNIFSRSVVLIVEHDEKGASGVILNKRNDKINGKLSNLGFDLVIYNGGPVACDELFFLIANHQSELNGDQSYLSGDMDCVFSQITKGDIDIEDITVFYGYSGWGPLQLDDEVQNKLWIIASDFELNFTAHQDETLWKKIMQNLGGDNLIFANAPENISLN